MEPAITSARQHPLLADASVAAPGSSATSHLEDANMLLALLCFLAPCAEIPLELLSRGVNPRKRWDIQGKIEETDATHVGLASELGTLLSDFSRLSNALHVLHLSSAVSKDSDKIYTLSEAAATRARGGLRPKDVPFWKSQALIVVYRALPWKYIEPPVPTIKLFLPHLRHALEAFQDNFMNLSTVTRTDLALTLIEASRFPRMDWKHFVVAQASTATRGLEDRYVLIRIAQAEGLLHRLEGDVGRAAGTLNSLSQAGLSDPTDKRLHASIGLTTIQHALNHMQVDDLSMAEKSLEDWRPLDQRSTSPMEDVVLFRQNLLLGKILRFQCRFDESWAYLRGSQNIASRQKDLLIFDEELCDLTCDLADTLRELDNPVSAEEHLRAEITRRGPVALDKSGCLLQLSLAEALFAQSRFDEAEQLCLEIQSYPDPLKLVRLRLFITLSKLRHINSDFEGARTFWAEAMEAASKYSNETLVTRVIALSICDILSRQGVSTDDPIFHHYLGLASLRRLSKPGGRQCWIAGLQHWEEYLRLEDGPLSSYL